jgi:hypothetical protein
MSSQRNGRRLAAAHQLGRVWKKQARVAYEARAPVGDLPLAALLLHGLTFSEDEGPALDALRAVLATVDGWATTGDEVVTVAQVEVRICARRIEVVMELLRRGLGPELEGA